MTLEDKIALIYGGYGCCDLGEFAAISALRRLRPDLPDEHFRQRMARARLLYLALAVESPLENLPHAV